MREASGSTPFANAQICRFILFYHKRHPPDMGKTQVEWKWATTFCWGTVPSAIVRKTMLRHGNVNHQERQDVQGVGRCSRRWKMFKALEDVQGVGRCSRRWKMFKIAKMFTGFATLNAL